MSKNTEKKWIIWSTDPMFDYDAFEEWKAEMEELNPDTEFNEEDWYQHVWDWLDDERMNLHKETNGVIVGFANLGLWNGRVNGARLYGTNVANVLDPFGSDYPEFYADRYNVRAKLPHHDGTNYVLFRVARDRETAEKLAEKIAFEGMTEKQFRKRTRSLRPYVAKVYGWR